MGRLIGEYLKTKGQNKAEANSGEWKYAALILLRRFIDKLRGEGVRDFTFDEFRTWALGRELDDPPHLNAWGALPRKAVAEGLIQPTDNMRKAQRVDAHARLVRVWSFA